MGKRIIYKNDDGTVAVIIPTDECKLTIEQIAKKDVPTGKPYKIIEETDLPNSREYRNAWTINDAELTDGVGE